MRFLSAVEGLIVDHHTRGMLTVIPFYTMDDKKSGLQMQVCQWFDELAILVGVLSQLRVLVPSEIIRRGAESFLSCSLQPSQLSNTSWSVSCFTWQRAPSSEQEMWEFSTQPWQTGREGAKLRKWNRVLVFRLSVWKDDFQWDPCPPLVFHL